MAGRLPILTGKATFDLRLDVERGLAARDPALVAGLNEGAHLGAQGVVRGRRGGQGGELGVDVAALAPAGRTRGEHLPDLLVAERIVDPRGLAIKGHPAAADVVVAV